ncbi:MAG TPA: hypothetical protein VII69_09065, partial [Candidatus Eremiobacteraceae bacterium]
MRLSIVATAVILAALAAPASAAGQDQIGSAQSERSGYELPDITPAPATPVVFVDVLKQSAPWMSPVPLSMDGDGEVVALAPGQSAQRVVFAPGQQHPAGLYTLLYDGRGSFEFAGASIDSRAAGRYTVNVSSTNAALNLRLVSTDQNDPARNVRLIMPGFENSYATHPFSPRLVESLAGAQTLRFALWSRAATYVRSAVWPLRPRASRTTQAAEAGVAPEYDIALANAAGTDPWITLPVGATDAYVYGIADLTHRLLDPRLHPIFEYGDRVWADGTPSNAYARMAARNLGLPGDARTGALEWYSLRSTRVFAVIDRVYGRDAASVVHTLSVPGSDDALDAAASRIILAYAGAARHADVLAVGAGTDVAIADALTISRAAGGPAAAWRPAGSGRWTGAGMTQRVAVTPDARFAFVAGADTTPRPEREGRPATALHIAPLVASKVASPSIGAQPGVAGALGDPLENVDLSREGFSDWIYARSPQTVEAKLTGGHQIAVRPISGIARSAANGFATFVWSDGAMRSRGSSASGVAVTGAGNGFRVTAPA